MYTVVGYDKDNDVYEEYGEYSSIWPAYRKAIELEEMVKNGELRRKDNEEPIDWVGIYGKWNTHDEYKVGVFSGEV